MASSTDSGNSNILLQGLTKRFDSVSQLSSWRPTLLTANVDGFAFPYQYVADSTVVADGVYSLNAKGGNGAQPGRWISTSPTVSLKEYGALGGGIVDDTEAIKKAILSSASSRKSLEVLSNSTYKITQGLFLDVTKTRIIGNAVWDFSGLPANSIALTVAGAGDGLTAPYNQNKNGIDSLELKGSSAKDSIGIKFVNAAEPGTSHTVYNKINVNSFNIGIQLGDNAYCNTFTNVNVHNCNVCLDMPASNNSGERITFSGSTFFNSGLAIRNTNSNSDLYLTNCSLDYNTKQFELNGSRVIMMGGHIEGKNYGAYPVTITGSGGFLNLNGVTVLNTENTAMPVAYFNVTTPELSGLVLRDCFLHNIFTTSLFLKDGYGPGVCYNPQFYSNPLGIRHWSKEANYLRDGSFELSTILDYWRIDGFGTRVSRTSMGVDSSISLSTDQARTGTKSLKWTKKFGGGTESNISIYVPVTEGELLSFGYYYKKPGSSNGFLYTTFQWILNGYMDEAGVVQGSSADIGGLNLTLPSTAVNWTLSEISPRIVPKNATHFRLAINGVDWDAQTESIYIDDVVCSSWGGAYIFPALGAESDRKAA